MVSDSSMTASFAGATTGRDSAWSADATRDRGDGRLGAAQVSKRPSRSRLVLARRGGSRTIVRLSRLSLSNFRSCEGAEVCFAEDLTVLVGENASGKSAVIDAIRLVTTAA